MLPTNVSHIVNRLAPGRQVRVEGPGAGEAPERSLDTPDGSPQEMSLEAVLALQVEIRGLKLAQEEIRSSLAVLAEAIVEVTRVLKLPVKPVYDNNGKLVCAQRIEELLPEGSQT